MHEAQVHDISWFATLTYKELPENGSLNPAHFRSFVKDLRRFFPPRRISYFGCGEYGDRNERPHYHAVLFGADFLDRYSYVNDNGSNVWGSPTLDFIWSRGRTELGTLTMASASYVAGYVRKKLLKNPEEDHYERVNPDSGELVSIEPEFARMSLRPAIGRRWIERWWRDLYPRDYVVVDGIEAKPPRYYDKWMDQDHDPDTQDIPCKDCLDHQMVMESVRDKRWSEAKELTKYQLASKEAIHEARMGLYSRRDRV